MDSPRLGSNVDPGEANTPSGEIAAFKGGGTSGGLIQVSWAVASKIVSAILQGLQGVVGCPERPSNMPD